MKEKTGQCFFDSFSFQPLWGYRYICQDTYCYCVFSFSGFSNYNIFTIKTQYLYLLQAFLLLIINYMAYKQVVISHKYFALYFVTVFLWLLLLLLYYNRSLYTVVYDSDNSATRLLVVVVIIIFIIFIIIICRPLAMYFESFFILEIIHQYIIGNSNFY